MNNGIAAFITFVAGAAVGSIVTWQLAKKKYEKEIDSVKETFSGWLGTKKELDDEPVKTSEPAEIEFEVTEADLNEYQKELIQLGYNTEENMKKGEPVTMDKPYIIAPEEFGENDYETISLTYYADRVLADEMDEVIDNVDDIVGSESLEHFGEYEDDSVFVRNDRLKVDYEILLDVRNYSDVVG